MAANRHTGGNFDWIAPVYDTLAHVVFGKQLQTAQAVFLDRIPANARVLLVGGGTGWLLEQVMNRCQPRQLVYLELSPRMLARASRRLVRRSLIGTVDFRVGDETALTPDDRFDVILTPFVLDLYPEKTLHDMLIPRLHQALEPGGLWLITDFVNPRKSWQKALLWTMIRFFRLTATIPATRLADWQKLLAGAGLRVEKKEVRVGGMVATEVWRMPTSHSATGSLR